jgi:hypothetical protein
MAPIHETDAAAERWSKAEWAHYELWEKLELRHKRRRLLWIFGTIALFLVLSSVPILIDRTPKWTAMSISRRLAQLINGMKTQVGIRHQPFRIRFAADGSLNYEITRVSSCTAPDGEVVRSGSLGPEGGDPFVLLSPAEARAFDLPGIVNSFCYDPYTGAIPAEDGKPLVGFAVLPAKDLAVRRSDRLSVLLIQGPSAELSFD